MASWFHTTSPMALQREPPAAEVMVYAVFGSIGILWMP